MTGLDVLFVQFRGKQKRNVKPKLTGKCWGCAIRANCEGGAANLVMLISGIASQVEINVQHTHGAVEGGVMCISLITIFLEM